MSPSLIIGTHAVSTDEPCYNLAEVNLQSPGSRGWHRYQILHVVRNDRLAELRLDMGLAGATKANQFRIPGGVQDEVSGRIEILHTVGELRDIADYLRGGFHPPPEYEPTDFKEGYLKTQDMKQLARRRRSTFGAKVAVQRS